MFLVIGELRLSSKLYVLFTGDFSPFLCSTYPSHAIVIIVERIRLRERMVLSTGHGALVTEIRAGAADGFALDLQIHLRATRPHRCLTGREDRS